MANAKYKKTGKDNSTILFNMHFFIVIKISVLHFWVDCKMNVNPRSGLG